MDKIVNDAKKLYKTAVEADQHNRDLALEDVKFALLGEQWDDAAARQRAVDGRPCLTINKLPSHIRQVVNDARQNKPSIRIRPVDDDADPETAEVLSGLIRNIEITSSASIAYDTAIQQSVSGGFGYIRVNIDYAHDDTFDKDIHIDRILNQFSVFPDHNSTSADGSDWNYCFITDRIPKEDFKEKYPNAKQINWETDFKDKHYDFINSDGVWVAEYWTREEMTNVICQMSDGTIVDKEIYAKNEDTFALVGLQKVQERETKSYKVTQYIISGAEVLETNEWAGKYIPVVPVYGEEVAIEGKRYFKSLVRDSKDAQRSYNYWRSTTTELVALAPKTPFIGEEGSFTNPDKWANANTQSYAYLEHKKGTPAPQRQPFAGVPAGALQESLNSADDIKATMGMFDASLGAKSNETSGKAIMARQREGDIGTFHFIDNMSRAIEQIGRIIVDLIPSVYTGERIVRVLGEDGKDISIVKFGQSQNQDMQEGEGEQENEGFNLNRIYDISVGKYDVVVDTGPSYTSKREEAATQMSEMIRVFPQIMQVAGDLLFKSFDWPGAEDISKRLKTMLPPQLQGQNPELMQMQQQMQQMQGEFQAQMQQMQEQLQQAGQEAEKARLQAESLKTDKLIEEDRLKIDAFNAETNRLKVVQTGMTREQTQSLIIDTVNEAINQNIINQQIQQDDLLNNETL